MVKSASRVPIIYSGAIYEPVKYHSVVLRNVCTSYINLIYILQKRCFITRPSDNRFQYLLRSWKINDFFRFLMKKRMKKTKKNCRCVWLFRLCNFLRSFKLSIRRIARFSFQLNELTLRVITFRSKQPTRRVTIVNLLRVDSISMPFFHWYEIKVCFLKFVRPVFFY